MDRHFIARMGDRRLNHDPGRRNIGQHAGGTRKSQHTRAHQGVAGCAQESAKAEPTGSAFVKTNGQRTAYGAVTGQAVAPVVVQTIRPWSVGVIDPTEVR